MNDSPETAVQISFPKALLLSGASMSCFAVALLIIGVPLRDPLVFGFITALVTVMTVAFAWTFWFVLRCTIDREGLRCAVPWGYTRVLRWNDMTFVRSRWPFYIVRGKTLADFCLLPYRFLLKQPERLRQLVEQYAPEDNILRQRLNL